MTVNDEEQVSYKAGEELYHHAVRAPGQPMVDIEVLFPPTKEGFDIPAQFINGHNVFGGEVEPVGCQPVCYMVYPVADDTNCFFGLVDAFCAEENYRIIKDGTVRRNGKFVETGF